MGRRAGVAVRSKANEVRAKLAAKRKERDERIVAHVTDYTEGMEKVELLRAELAAAERGVAASVLALSEEEVNRTDIAEYLDLTKNEVDRLLREAKKNAAAPAPQDGGSEIETEPSEQTPASEIPESDEPQHEQYPHQSH